MDEAAVEHVYPLEQYKEAFKQSLKSNRSGKILSSSARMIRRSGLQMA